ncbi:alpha-galactosidase [uncultured Limosilactobacillus sp.]|uniref:alpha-galactosidase n=1 Tax=uncultured Limosilactobacillus sp. TaxID=2837629 RepID=UPI0025CC18EB|nr:alpha-galactosidase [uncultured Limosilactobacillus sp.]
MITFDSKQHVFHLKNKDISYIFSIEEGKLLSHLYFGPALRQYHGERRYPRVDRGFSGNLPGSTDRTFSKDDLLQEYSGNNTGDYRIPAITVKGPDGAQLTDFRYQSYEIQAGKPALKGLPAAYVNDDHEAETLNITLHDATLAIDLILSYTIYRDRPVITRNARLVNSSQQPIEIQKIASLQLDLPKGSEERELVYLPGQYGHERQVKRAKIEQGIFEISSRRNSSSHHMNPFAAIVDSSTTEFQGNALGILLVYSGNHQIQIEKDQIDQLRILAGINEFNFNWRLAPNEEFQTPEAIMAFSDHGLNGMSQTFHHLLTERVARGKYKYAERPIVINNWEATFFDFDDQKLDQVVKEAAPLGIEMFVLDDGWFGHRNDDNSSLGDWFVNTKKVNLAKVAKQTHKHGMKFGLWFEPEMISVDSELYQKHPEWVLHEPNRGMTLSRNQLVLDFSQPAVVENVFQQMCAVLDSADINYIKWDFNRNLTEVFSTAWPANQQGSIAHRYILGLYQLLEKLTTRYPDILFEGCSGGGGRFDAGILYYMPQSWASDDTDAADRMKIQYGTSLVFPTSAISAHVSVSPNQQTGRQIDFATRGAVAMSGVFGYELDLEDLTAKEKAMLKEQISFYKQHRHLIQYGDFYRLISPFDGSPWAAWEFVSRDRAEALLFTFKREHTNRYEIFNTKLVGLDPYRNYRMDNSNHIYGGDELMQSGLLNDPTVKGDFKATIHYFKEL